MIVIIRKIKSIIPVENDLKEKRIRFVFIINNSKNENKIGYFKTELVKPISPLYFNDKKRISALISLCSILNVLLPESQPNKNIYNAYEKFINSIHLENWVYLYIFFELNLVRDLGYDPNLEKFKSNLTEQEIKKIKIDTFTYEVPEYLINGNLPMEISNELVKKSLYFTRNIVQNKFFIPNNLVFPKSRVLLENYFN